MKTFITTVAAATLMCVGFGAHAGSSSAMAKQAKISMQQARKIALRTYPGKIVSGELEKERGGSGLRYSFDISNKKNPHVLHEVGVDAKTGKVLENSIDNDKD